ncbi:MAG: ParA family protein [Bacteroidetes bacterium QS_9_68_14]|nr:MAG: ParA family protein [Bacteroidetes bacterium QS_9_68_14]
MVVATVCNHKGGTGKTTSALGLAAALGLSGRRVLLVDLDPQAFLSRTLGTKDPDARHSSLALFDEETRLGALRAQPMSGFDLLPAHGRLTRRMRRLSKPTDVFWVKETLAQGRSEATSEYDVLLFDTAAAVTVYSLNALVASDHAVIPVTPEYQPVVGAEQTYQTTQTVQSRLNPGLAEPHFLLTQVDGRKRAHKRYRRYLREQYGECVLQSVIRTSSALARTPEDGTTVFDYAPQARGARDYANAADEWVARVEAARSEREPAPPEVTSSPGEARSAGDDAPAASYSAAARASLAGSPD